MNEIKPVDEDITEAELQAIQDQVDSDIEKDGLPSEEELHKEIERMNASE